MVACAARAMSTTIISDTRRSTTNTSSPFARGAIIGGKRCERWSVDDASLERPLRWKAPRKIWLARDLFAEGVPDDWIDRVFAVMALAPQHTFQVLTKRADRMRAYIRAQRDNPRYLRFNDHELSWTLYEGGVPKHIWLGVSVEDQPRADERIPVLLATPAAVRFISAEPLLGPVDLRLGPQSCDQCQESGSVKTFDPIAHPGGRMCPDCQGCGYTHRALDWVITGGESGSHARGACRAWYRSLRDQCAAAGVPYFHKQNGEWIDADEWLDGMTSGIARHNGERWQPARPLNHSDAAWLAEACGRGRPDQIEHHSDGTTLIRVGKEAAGRLLDGRVHSEFPA